MILLATISIPMPGINPLVSGTEGWAQFAYWLGDLVHYREVLAVS
ncbi:hypothetical protein [Aurantiacibacter gilvus]|uniref:Uncharacterized protein n=1 Tax=Aurantiacibacter gilvus TaxID=3139141 RepID=A0ABU9IEV4_9SPHN